MGKHVHDHGFDTLGCRLRAEFADVHPKRNRTLDRFDDVRNGNIDRPAAERVPGWASGDSAECSTSLDRLSMCTSYPSRRVRLDSSAFNP